MMIRQEMVADCEFNDAASELDALEERSGSKTSQESGAISPSIVVKIGR